MNGMIDGNQITCKFKKYIVENKYSLKQNEKYKDYQNCQKMIEQGMLEVFNINYPSELEEFKNEHNILKKLPMSSVRKLLLSNLDEVKDLAAVRINKNNSTDNYTETLVLFVFYEKTTALNNLKYDEYYKSKQMHIIENIVKAVAELHCKRILHLNLDIHNIYLNEELDPIEVKLSSFNQAKKVETEISIDNAVYYLPEVKLARHRKKTTINANKSMDVYMMGILFLQILSKGINQDPTYFVEKDNTILNMFVNKIKERLSFQEKQILDLIISEIIKKTPENRIKAKHLLKKIEKIKNYDLMMMTPTFCFINNLKETADFNLEVKIAEKYLRVLPSIS